MRILHLSVRVSGILLVCGLTGLASAEPEFLELVKAKYKAGSCQACHTEAPLTNVYGKAIKAEMERAGVDTLKANILARLDDKDSDGDGVPNGTELVDGMSPGEANTVTMRGPLEARGPVVPKHAFHPLVAHFPIGLFLFGVLLDFIGVFRKDSALRRFALWNLGFGAISAVATVGTGLATFLMRGFAYEGGPFLHLLFGTSACVFMLVAGAMKVKRPDAGGWYWVVLLLATGCTMISGHLGAAMVHG